MQTMKLSKTKVQDLICKHLAQVGNWTIPKGGLVQMNLYSLHRNKVTSSINENIASNIPNLSSMYI